MPEQANTTIYAVYPIYSSYRKRSNERALSQCACLCAFATLETRWSLGRVEFRKDFWDCHWGHTVGVFFNTVTLLFIEY